MKRKHSNLGLSISPKGTKGGHLQVEGHEEEKEKAKIMMKWMERRRRRSNLTNPR